MANPLRGQSMNSRSFFDFRNSTLNKVGRWNYNLRREAPTSLLNPPLVVKEQVMASANFTKTESERQKFGNWLAGFVAGEGWFQLSIERRCQRARFGIALRQDDRPVLEKIRDFLDCGNITIHPRRGNVCPVAKFVIGDALDLERIVVPLFQNHPLRAKKSRDFEIWKRGVALICRNRRKPVRWMGGWKQGSFSKWNEDIEEFTQLNDSLKTTRRYSEDFSIDDSPISDPELFGDWFAGFSDGEGCLDLQHYVQNECWTGAASFRLKIRFDDFPILNQIRNFLGKGSISRIERDGKNNPRAHFLVTGCQNLADFVIPVLEKYPLRAKKKRDFVLWKEGVALLCQVKSRPRQGRGGWGAGFHPKWTEGEKSKFVQLCAELKELRRFLGKEADHVR